MIYTRVGLHYILDTLVRKSAHLIYPHITPKFDLKYFIHNNILWLL